MAVRERLDRVWPSLVALLGTVAVVAGLLFLFGEDGDPADDAEAVAEGTQAPTAEPSAEATTAPSDAAPPTPVTAPPGLRERVGILNGTDVNGLASRAQERLEAGGWEVPVIDTYSEPLETTTVFYPDGMQESAQALAAQFPEITQVQPTLPNLTTQWLVLIVGDDYVDVVESSG
ncbi:MAG: LytR C-terminal domain-containing protein [Jiangellaceae bacterium]